MTTTEQLELHINRDGAVHVEGRTHRTRRVVAVASDWSTIVVHEASARVGGGIASQSSFHPSQLVVWAVDEELDVGTFRCRQLVTVPARTNRRVRRRLGLGIAARLWGPYDIQRERWAAIAERRNR